MHKFKTADPKYVIQTNKQTKKKTYKTGDTGNRTNDVININAQEQQDALPKQLSLPANLFGNLAFRRPCECDNGVCGCCTGMLFAALKQLGCLNVSLINKLFIYLFIYH